MKHLPNAITILRILVTPVILVLLLQDALWPQFWGTFLFILASISDYVDGKLARKLEVRSRLGQFLDPLADKVLVLGTFIVLAILEPQSTPWWGVAIIALRDVFVTGLRSWAEARGRSLRTLYVAKAKTTVQLTYLISMQVFLTASKVAHPLAEPARWILDSMIPLVVFVFVALFTAYTGLVYAFNMETQTPAAADEGV